MIFGQQRDRVLGIVVLGKDDNPGAGVALTDFLRGVDPLGLEVRRHPDVGHEHVGNVLLGARDQFVVVGGDGDDLEIRLDAEERPNAFTYDEVVVGEQHGDGSPRHDHHSRPTPRSRSRKVALHPPGGTTPLPQRRGATIHSSVRAA